MDRCPSPRGLSRWPQGRSVLFHPPHLDPGKCPLGVVCTLGFWGMISLETRFPLWGRTPLPATPMTTAGIQGHLLKVRGGGGGGWWGQLLWQSRHLLSKYPRLPRLPGPAGRWSHEVQTGL